MPALHNCLGPFASYFPHKKLTQVQERVIPTMVQKDFNVVVAAPTGSGKTALLEAAMLRLFRDRLISKAADLGAARFSGTVENDEAAVESTGRKAVYVCPMRALAFEKYTQWREQFPMLSVLMEIGDQKPSRPVGAIMSDMINADVIITTPERWDGITRRWKEGVVWNFVACVALLMLDEVHIVSEERGAALEAVVSRMKAIKSSTSVKGPRGCATRFVAISGTLPNVEDFAEWLQVPPAGVFTFTSEARPLPLTLRVVSYPATSNNAFAFERFLNAKLFGLIRRHGEGRPTLVFCASRTGAVNSARRIVEELREAATREGSERQLCANEHVQLMTSTANDKQLRAMLLLGVAYHHAALTTSDRVLVERMFKEHYISVICTTTTLALGVNLPAHLVIVKGTTFFKNGTHEDLPLSEVAQMTGRAGRPGFDTHGVALVLTTDGKASLYEPLQHGDVGATVESCLHQNMVEHVNAEVALRTIHSLSLGVEWIKTTFFWIRLQRCPRHYNIVFDTKQEELDFDREQFADRLMQRMLAQLEREGCITVHPEGRSIGEAVSAFTHAEALQQRHARAEGNCGVGVRYRAVESTHVGRAMARRYILFETVKMLNREVLHTNLRLHGPQDTQRKAETVAEMKEGECVLASVEPFSIEEVLRIISHSSEFEDVRLRQGDRRHLNELNKSIRFPLKSGLRGGREVREDWHKVYVLIQAHLNNTAIPDVSLRNDCARLRASAPRVAHFVCDYAATQSRFSFTQRSSLLHRCIEHGTWWDGLILKQVEGVGESLVKALYQEGVANFTDVLEAEPRKLEVVCNKNPPFGTELQGKCRSYPMCDVSLEHCRETNTVRATISPSTAQRPQHNPWPKHPMVLLVGGLHSDRTYLLRHVECRATWQEPLQFSFHLPQGFQGRLQGCIMGRNFLGLDSSETLNIGDVRGKCPSKVFAAAQRPKRKDPERRKTESQGSQGNEAVNCAGADGNGDIGTTKNGKTDGEGAAERLTKFKTHAASVTFDEEANPLAVEAVETRNDKQDTIGQCTDEAFRSLLELKTKVAASISLVRKSPSLLCKRQREREEKETPGGLPSTQQRAPQKEEGTLSFVGVDVVLPKVSSPAPRPASDNMYGHLRPSPRFRFTVRGAPPRIAAQTPVAQDGYSTLHSNQESIAVSKLLPVTTLPLHSHSAHSMAHGISRPILPRLIPSERPCSQRIATDFFPLNNSKRQGFGEERFTSSHNLPSSSATQMAGQSGFTVTAHTSAPAWLASAERGPYGAPFHGTVPPSLPRHAVPCVRAPRVEVPMRFQGPYSNGGENCTVRGSNGNLPVGKNVVGSTAVQRGWW